jgi:transcriptional regulator with XRE-family HTH domain
MPQPRKHRVPPTAVRTHPVTETLVRYRKLRGLTQKQLADKVGITRDMLASYELGRARLDDELVVRLAVALGVSADALLGLAEASYEKDKPSLRIIRRVQRIERLPPMDQKVILRTIDSFLDGAESNNNKRRQ